MNPDSKGKSLAPHKRDIKEVLDKIQNFKPI